MDERTTEDLSRLKTELAEADRVLVGAGAGLSASAGLSYLDEGAFLLHFPEMYRLGYRCQ